MNGAGNYSNCSFNYENSWFGGRPKPSVSRIDIENDLYLGNRSPNFLSSCTSFLQLRLQERLRNDSLLSRSASQFNNTPLSSSSSNFDSCSVLKFANSCIQLQNIENYSHHIEKEIANSDGVTLNIDEILPRPMKKSKSSIIYTSFLKNLRNQFVRFKNIFDRNRVETKKIHLETKKSIKLVSQATQTELSSKKFKHIKKPSSISTMLKGRSSRMSVPEEVKEYQTWKANFSNEMKTKRQRIYKCPMVKCNSCMEVVETKVETKKFTKMRRQSSKLSVLNEEREYDDEFEAYWRQVKLKNSSRF